MFAQGKKKETSCALFIIMVVKDFFLICRVHYSRFYNIWFHKNKSVEIFRLYYAFHFLGPIIIENMCGLYKSKHAIL